MDGRARGTHARARMNLMTRDLGGAPSQVAVAGLPSIRARRIGVRSGRPALRPPSPTRAERSSQTCRSGGATRGARRLEALDAASRGGAYCAGVQASKVPALLAYPAVL